MNIEITFWDNEQTTVTDVEDWSYDDRFLAVKHPNIAEKEYFNLEFIKRLKPFQGSETT